MTKPEKARTQILAVSIDGREDTKKLIQQLKERAPGDYDFAFLEDKNHRVIDRYGIFNPDGRGWPHPSTLVIDAEGIVRWKFIEVDYTKRPSNEQIRRELAKIK